MAGSVHRISDPLAAVLRAGRQDFNAQFARARHQYPALSTGAFADFLAAGVDPVVRAVAAVAPDRVAHTVTAAYGIGLELVARNLVGPGAKHDAVTHAWQGLLPAAKELVAAAPQRILGAVSNAVCLLAATSGARPGWWLEEMVRLLPHLPTTDGVELFLRLGQITAWRAGMAHFRPGALTTLDALPESLACAALGLPTDTPAWEKIRARLDVDPWYNPALATAAGPDPAHFVSRVGEFRGFGGLFPEPPQVAGGGDGQFFVRSGDAHWLLMADAFGATFHRATPEEWARAAAGRPVLPGGGSRVDAGTVQIDRAQVPLPFCGEIVSHATNASTLAVTGSLTHAVLLVALGASSLA